MEEELKKEILEGKDVETSTTTDEEEEKEINVSNTTVPTLDEEVNAGFVSEEEQEGTSIPDNQDFSGTTEEAPATKSFSQSQVDEIAGRARKEGRDKAVKYFFSRYGVNSEEELDDLFSDAQRFLTARDDFDERTKHWEEMDATRNAELQEVKEKVALLESGIDKDRYEDAKLILKGKGLDITTDNIFNEMGTHPEWKKVEEVKEDNPLPFKKKSTPPTKIKVLGNNGADTKTDEQGISEKERILKMFGV